MINLVAPINTLGYGVASYNILQALWKDHKDVTLYPIGQPEFTNDVVSGALNNQETLSDLPIVKIWHQNELHILPEDLQGAKPLI